MTDDTEPRVRDALQALARRGGPPDHEAGWHRVTAAIDAENRSTGRHRALLAVGGLALAGSAAAVFAFVVDDAPDRQSVRVVSPADPATSVTEPSTVVTDPPVTEPPSTDMTHTGPTVTDPPPPPSTPTGVTPTSGPVPEHPLAAVGPEGIVVYDGDTGERLGMPVGPTGFSYSSMSFAPDGTLWFDDEAGDTHRVAKVEWGSTTVEHPFGTETASPAVSPDGTTLAYVHSGITVERRSIRFVDLATGEQTAELFWRDDDPDWFHTRGGIDGLEWSPDGRRLLFVSGYEGSEVLVLDRDAQSLSDATPLVVADSHNAHWAGNDRVVLIDTCCYPEHERFEVQVHDLATGEVTKPEVDGQPVDVDGRPDGTVGVLTEDHVLHLSDGRAFELPEATRFGF